MELKKDPHYDLSVSSVLSCLLWGNLSVSLVVISSVSKQDQSHFVETSIRTS